MYSNQILNSVNTKDLAIGKAIPSQNGHTQNLRGTRSLWLRCFVNRNASTLIKAWILIGIIFIGPTFGVTVQALQAPIGDLKDTLFNGWMWIAKIGAAVGGCVMAVYQRDIVPLATGAAVGLGIHFYDSYFGNMAQAALI